MNFNKMSIKDVDVKDKSVFIRVDFNVPQDDKLQITNTARIEAALPTIQYVIDQHCKYVVLCSHLGRPKGTGFDAKFSMKPVAEALQTLIKRPVTLLPDVVGEKVEEIISKATPQQIFLTENVRFYKEETSEDEKSESVQNFRHQLRKLADIYCDDAFGTAHRPHSSMVGEFFETRVAGFLLIKEINAFKCVMVDPKKPYLAIMGGAKIADKTKLIKNMLSKVDKIILCGGMAYAFNKKHGMTIGNSLYDAACDPLVDEIESEAKAKNVKLILPVDFRCAQDFNNDAEMKVFSDKEGIPDGWQGLDIGPETEKLFHNEIMSSKTICWNGPCGVFEFPNFAKGTFAVCKDCVEATKAGAITVIGGGDSATAAKKAKVIDQLTHVSTGGGAALELLEGRILPGVDRLSDRK